MRRLLLLPSTWIGASRTACGGLGLSIIRNGQLIAGVGAVTTVPLGSNIKVHVPGDLIANAEAVFKQRDPEFQFPELPVELSVGNCRRLLFRGWIQLEGYEVFMEHGYYIGIPLATSWTGAYCTCSTFSSMAVVIRP